MAAEHNVTPPELRFLCEIRAKLGAPVEIGPARAGLRRLIPILGGRVEGRISGQVLGLGADWQTINADGSAELDTRYVIETDDGARIDVRNFGLRHGPAEVLARVAAGESVDPALYYMRTHPRLETGDARYAWLNRTILLGTGARFASSVEVRFFEVL